MVMLQFAEIAFIELRRFCKARTATAVAVVTVLDASVVGSIAFGRPADLTDDAFLA
jgi:hypothetical protein